MQKIQKKWTTFKKVTVAISVTVGLVGVASASYGTYLFFRDNPTQTSLTPAQIEKYTTYKKTDSNLITTLKANALATHLATGDSSLIAELPKTTAVLDKLNAGTLKESEVESVLKSIKDRYKLPEYQITQLRVKYYSAALQRTTKTFNSNLDTLAASDLGTLREQALTIHSYASKLADGYAKDVNSDYPDGLNGAIDALNKFTAKLNQLIKFNDLFINPQTTLVSSIDAFGPLSNFESPLSSQFSKLRLYATTRDQVAAKTAELKAFKATIDESNRLKNGSIDLEDFVGKTVKDAKDWASKNNIKIAFSDDSSQKDDAVILDQVPGRIRYQRIMKGTTLTLTTAPEVKETPKSSEPDAPTVPSQSSSADKPTTPSSSTKPSDDSSVTPIIPPSSSSTTTPPTSSSDDKPIEINPSTTERKN